MLFLLKIKERYFLVLHVAVALLWVTKIAGYDVIGCNEIDPRMMKCYETNHHPQYSYLEDIRDLVKRNNLPEELYH